jgi:SNF2 family DNA or RNA helicase
MEFRPYQKEIINKALPLLKKDKFVYLAMEVRTGKTLTSLGVSMLLPVKNLLFITKKKAISSVENDYQLLNPSYDIEVINYESLHKVKSTGWDMVVCDEAHGMGAFPKRNKRSKMVKSLISENNPYVIFLSGTPTPESYSQMYHQVSVIKSNPFKEYVNFYKFSKQYVKVVQRKINSLYINDYSNGLDTIIDKMKPHTISYTQKEAGFKVKTTEHILEVELDPKTMGMIKKLKRDRLLDGSVEVVLADTPVKMMSKIHQLCSGTVKFESGKSMVVDTSKAKFIRKQFFDIKIGIFYKFKEELKALKEVFGDDLCTDLNEFNNTNKSIALQIVSGREGISLRNAKALVYYNIDFSATSYWQSRDRMTTKDRLESDVYWIFSKGGIEKEIYKAVSKKKDYTLRHFKRDLLTL